MGPPADLQVHEVRLLARKSIDYVMDFGLVGGEPFRYGPFGRGPVRKCTRGWHVRLRREPHCWRGFALRNTPLDIQ